ncbi:uncharacterized aarF domain-containing protein kinase 1-like isoform X2 [Dendronephthya gigantea]|uniref:uncharacterized aarF domain-containing protein kinase 1-like isoform X2 n=1 Tax=Dendronephthya gigantea TaxID=151771 RepID=UPI001068F8B4|nr:uncharacterized aarF domain-containing protein kinase 1-like isoform X2 [Dendronephthya gigantea]
MKKNAIAVGSFATFIMATSGGIVYYLGGVKEARLTGQGIVRFTRTALTVLQISYDYKRTLWGRNEKSEQFKELRSQVHSRSAKRLCDLCFRNAGLYIKIGQHLGSLDYLLPKEYVQVLKVFHHTAPRSSLNDVYHVFHDELNQNPDEIFQGFDVEPLGSASLAQVHKAILKNGQTVAVKVQHKNIQDHAASDVKTMEFLVNVVKQIFSEFQFTWLVEETKKNLPLELDFLNEGRNSEKIQEKFPQLKFLKVPKVFWEYSSKRVLTMEYCEGGYVNDLEYMKNNNISSDEVSSKVGEIYSEMIFVQGCIHCDPHPGNILIRKNRTTGVEIVLLDHGLYHEITDDFRINYCKLWQSIISADLEGIKAYSEKMDVGEFYGIFACMLSARTWNTVISGMKQTPFSQNEMEELRSSVAMYLSDISNVLNRVPRQLLLILKTNDLLRGIDHQLRTSEASRSFVTMSKCCAKAVAREEWKSCTTWYDRLMVYGRWSLDNARITLYQLSVQDFFISTDILVSVATNFVSLLFISMLFGAS